MEPKPIVSPEPGCRSFEAGGVTYTRTDELSLGRGIKLQRLQTELQFNMSIAAVQKTMMECKADFNGMKLVDGFVKFGRLTDGLDLLGQNRFREAEILALFYNAPGEDAAADGFAQVVEPKVAAWRAAGIGTTFFTRAAYWLLLDFQQRSRLQPGELPASLAPLPDLPTS